MPATFRQSLALLVVLSLTAVQSTACRDREVLPIGPFDPEIVANGPGPDKSCGDHICCSADVCTGITSFGIGVVAEDCTAKGGDPLDLDDDGTAEGCDYTP